MMMSKASLVVTVKSVTLMSRTVKKISLAYYTEMFKLTVPKTHPKLLSTRPLVK